MQSHPEWVRGLKHESVNDARTRFASHPEWVRGLKPELHHHHAPGKASHPEWVRGLKPDISSSADIDNRRTPSGCVD